jgi:GGDEF domain-containing protein
MKHAVSGLAVARFALPITLSIGLTFATPCETATSMLARADMALYNAKRAGRNCIRILLESIDQDSSDNASIRQLSTVR